jgi:hypothetical protein
MPLSQPLARACEQPLHWLVCIVQLHLRICARVHHSLLAAAAVLLAWFYVTWHIAGVTLNY